MRTDMQSDRECSPDASDDSTLQRRLIRLLSVCTLTDRNPTFIPTVLAFKPSDGNLTSFCSFNNVHLNSSSKSYPPALTAWDLDEGPLTDEEMEDAISSQNALSLSVLPPVEFSGFAGDILKTDSVEWGPLYVVKASFDSRKVLLEGKRPPFSPKKRNSWTEDQRKIVLKGEKPQTLQEFSLQIRDRYDSDSGAIRPKQKWLFLTKEAIGGVVIRREVKVVDKQDRTIVTVDSTLPEEHRKCLWNAVAAFCYATGVKLLNRDTSELDHTPIFQGKPIPQDFHPLHITRSDGSKVNHCQFFVRASKDLQTFGREFVALSEAIGYILQNIVDKRIARDPELFGKDLDAMIDIMPLHDFTPVRPFTGLVININSVTAAHKDAGDLGGCLVISLGSYEGGELCLYQPRLAVETRNGDIVSFPSHDYLHFNLHYKGDRCSVVVQTDKTGLSYLKDGNGWLDNPWKLFKGKVWGPMVKRVQRRIILFYFSQVSPEELSKIRINPAALDSLTEKLFKRYVWGYFGEERVLKRSLFFEFLQGDSRANTVALVLIINGIRRWILEEESFMST
ncbi:hypothetical protein F5880DRAFT_1507356 [Lentinula raphanica]|nr:hypothetical protein F5880DRAFT_1507356 [Lentinula raphanica]